MDYLDTIDSLMLNLIKRQPSLQNIIPIIKKDMESHFNESDLCWLSPNELSKSYLQFETWLDNLLQTEPLTTDIIAINFGIFESDSGIQLYISGSCEWDKDDFDWACCNDYFPNNRYPKLDIFKFINEINVQNEYSGIYLSLAISTVLIISYINKNNNNLINNAVKSLYISTGFDDGDLYNIGELSKDGLSLIV